MNHGFTLWFTGLSGSGKSTLAYRIAEELQQRGRLVELLDGDVVRQHLSKGLSFSREDRDINIRRIGFVAHLVTRHGGIAITAAISPYRAIREENRRLIGNFVEIYCNCPLEICEARDIKGLYKKAREALSEGRPMHFTGIDDPYEPPDAPEIEVDTGSNSIEHCVTVVMDDLQRLGYLDGSKFEISHEQRHLEYLPETLIVSAEAALRKAGRVHTDVLLQALNVGLSTAARLIDALAERGAIGLQK